MNCIFCNFSVNCVEANVLGELEFVGKQGVWILGPNFLCPEKT